MAPFDLCERNKNPHAVFNIKSIKFLLKNYLFL